MYKFLYTVLFLAAIGSIISALGGMYLAASKFGWTLVLSVTATFVAAQYAVLRMTRRKG